MPVREMTLVPHRGQNRSAAPKGAPQRSHPATGAAVPQKAQNRSPARSNSPHRPQVIPEESAGRLVMPALIFEE
jgi:hypothetical protein